MTQTETTTQNRRPVLRYIIAAVALVFGVATIKAGGDVLFFNAQAKASAGNYVLFVLWANFVAGFLYVICAAMILLRPALAFNVAAFIAVATAVVFAALGLHIASGGAYEMRTVYAMVFRTTIWITIAIGLQKINGSSRGKE